MRYRPPILSLRGGVRKKPDVAIFGSCGLLSALPAHNPSVTLRVPPPFTQGRLWCSTDHQVCHCEEGFAGNPTWQSHGSCSFCRHCLQTHTRHGFAVPPSPKERARVRCRPPGLSLRGAKQSERRGNLLAAAIFVGTSLRLPRLLRSLAMTS